MEIPYVEEQGWGFGQGSDMPKMGLCVTVVTPSQLGTPVTPVMSPDFTYYSGSSS